MAETPQRAEEHKGHVKNGTEPSAPTAASLESNLEPRTTLCREREGKQEAPDSPTDVNAVEDTHHPQILSPIWGPPASPTPLQGTGGSRSTHRVPRLAQVQVTHKATLRPIYLEYCEEVNWLLGNPGPTNLNPET